MELYILGWILEEQREHAIAFGPCLPTSPLYTNASLYTMSATPNDKLLALFNQPSQDPITFAGLTPHGLASNMTSTPSAQATLPPENKGPNASVSKFLKYEEYAITPYPPYGTQKLVQVPASSVPLKFGKYRDATFPRCCETIKELHGYA